MVTNKVEWEIDLMLVWGRSSLPQNLFMNIEKPYTIYFPEELASLLQMNEEEFSQEIKYLTVIKLFELGKISSGKCASILGMSRIAFFDLLAQYESSMFNDSDIESLEQDLQNA